MRDRNEKRRSRGQRTSSEQPMEECYFCHTVLPLSSLFFICRDCPDTLLICTQCFMAQKQDLVHKTYHKYAVSPNLTTRSWKLISKHIGTKRDKQCENYYINRYVTGVLRDEQNEEMRLLSSRKSSLFLNEYEKEQDNKKEREIQRKAIKINQLQKKGRIKGYNIARDEFKVEHENDAEKELLGIALGDEEVFRLNHPERKRKLETLHHYVEVLKERKRRRSIAIRLAIPEMQYVVRLKHDKKVDSEEQQAALEVDQEVRKFLRPFLSSTSFEEYNEMVNTFAEEIRLRQRLDILIHNQQNGIESLGQIPAKERAALGSYVSHTRSVGENESSPQGTSAREKHMPVAEFIQTLNATNVTTSEKELKQFISAVCATSDDRWYKEVETEILKLLIENKVVKKSYKTGKYFSPERTIIPQAIMIDACKSGETVDIRVRLVSTKR